MMMKDWIKNVAILSLVFALLLCTELNRWQANNLRADISDLHVEANAQTERIVELSHNLMMQRQQQLDYSSVIYLAATMYGEARSEGSRGMREVGMTILARAQADTPKGRQWGRGVVGTVLHHRQFSVWNRGDPNYSTMMDILSGQYPSDTEWQQAYALAHEMLITMPSDGSLFYHATSITPYWVTASSPTDSYVIGNHVFYPDL